MITNTPFAIISAERAELLERQNTFRSNKLRYTIDADSELDWLASLGAYKFSRERSITVLVPSERTRAEALHHDAFTFIDGRYFVAV